MEIFSKNIRSSLKVSRSSKVRTLAALSVLSMFLISSSAAPSEAALTSNATVSVMSKAAVLQPPTGLIVSVKGGSGKTGLDWIATTSTYATGYKILRATTAAGPWTTIGTVSGVTTITYTDNASLNTPWKYRVETVWQNWTSVSPAV